MMRLLWYTNFDHLLTTLEPDMSHLCTKRGRLTPNGTNMAFFSDQVSENVLKSDLKNPIYVAFGINLPHFVAGSAMPA